MTWRSALGYLFGLALVAIVVFGVYLMSRGG